jgi:murein DD-endopeptidase MepM/ murein hydrolase activator NlpD
MKPATWAKAIGAVALAAVLDANVFHWSTPVGGAQPAPVAGPVDPSGSGPAAGGGAPAPAAGGWFPPLPPAAVAGLQLDRPHHNQVIGIDLAVPAGTPIYAMHPGLVAYVSGGCGLGIKVVGAGVATKSCHSQRRLVAAGTWVAAGAHIADVGSTGDSTGPHLHLELEAGGRVRCPGPVLLALYGGRPVPDPARLPATGCSS